MAKLVKDIILNIKSGDFLFASDNHITYFDVVWGSLFSGDLNYIFNYEHQTNYEDNQFCPKDMYDIMYANVIIPSNMVGRLSPNEDGKCIIHVNIPYTPAFFTNESNVDITHFYLRLVSHNENGYSRISQETCAFPVVCDVKVSPINLYNISPSGKFKFELVAGKSNVCMGSYGAIPIFQFANDYDAVRYIGNSGSWVHIGYSNNYGWKPFLPSTPDQTGVYFVCKFLFHSDNNGLCDGWENYTNIRFDEFKSFYDNFYNTAYICTSGDGDFMVGYSDDQSAQLLSICGPGKHYRYPTTGVDVTKYINSVVGHTDLGDVASEQFNENGTSIQEMSFDSLTGDMQIVFNHENYEDEDDNLLSVELLDLESISVTDEILAIVADEVDISDFDIDYDNMEFDITVPDTLLMSCFANGVWMAEMPWTGTELWKGQE